MGATRFRERRGQAESKPSGVSGMNYGDWRYETPSIIGEPWLSHFHETCIDQTHPRVGGRYTSGGPFDCASVSYEATPVSLQAKRGNSGGYDSWDYFSGLVVTQLAGLPPAKVDVSQLNPAYGDIASLGATAWKRFKPGKPIVGTTEFLVELREAPQMVRDLRNRARELRNVGKKYLEIQFGWKPFLSDLYSAYQLACDVEKRIGAIRSGNGKWLKRGGTFSREESSVVMHEAEGSNAYSILPTHCAGLALTETAWHRSVEINSQHVWFEGSFRYYIEPSKFDSPVWRWNTIRKLYGLSVTPAQVWELTPWSWLVDYFTNAGDVIHNLASESVVDDLVARYAYLMGTTSIVRRTNAGCDFHNGTRGSVLKTTSVTCETSYTETRKLRVAADPFGFGTSGDLNARQIAILSALGLSRSR